MLLDCLHHGLLLGNGPRQWFFTVDILFLPRCFDGRHGMPMIGTGNHHRINVVSRQQLAKVMIPFAVLVLILVVDYLDRVAKMVLINVTCCDDLTVLLGQERMDVR